MIRPITAFLQARYGRGFANQAMLETFQAAGIADLRRRIMPRSPFYAAFAARPIGDWPVMNKAGLMANFTAINTCGITLETALETALRAEQSRDFAPMIGKIAVGLSTGTSGQRGLFLTNPHERALWAAVMVGRFWPGALWRKQRIAFFLRADNALYQGLSNPLIQFTFHDLLRPMEGHLDQLDRDRPTVLIAPAQILRLIAKAQLARQIRLRPLRIISVAEVLSPEDAEVIRQAFGIAPDQVYQCTEGVLGQTCRSGRLHLNERFVHVERDVLDAETGAFCPIITDFTRESLPILRYRLDDVLIPDPDPCPCGCASQRLKRIEGRADDILYWRTVGGGRRLVPSDVIRQMVATLPASIGDYRAHQLGEDRLILWLEGNETLEAARLLPATLDRIAAGLGAIAPVLELRFGLPPDRGPKRRRVTAAPVPESTTS